MMEKASERAGNYQSSLLPTVLGINNQARWALGQLRSCRNSHGIFHSYTNGSKSFLWLSLPTNIKGALTAAGWQSKLSACRTQMTSCNWFHSQAITTQAINPVPGEPPWVPPASHSGEVCTSPALPTNTTKPGPATTWVFQQQFNI